MPKKVRAYIKELYKPKEEFGGMPTCPYAHPHVLEDKMDIREWDPKKTNIIDELKAFVKSDYRSTAWYVEDINERALNKHDLGVYMATFNPKDKLNVNGFAPRSMSPYFIVGVAYLDELNEAHEKLMDTKYFDKLSGEYKEQLV